MLAFLQHDPEQIGYIDRESDILDKFSKQSFFQQDNPTRRNTILSTENAGLPRTPANNRRSKHDEQQHSQQTTTATSTSMTPHIVIESFKVP